MTSLRTLSKHHFVRNIAVGITLLFGAHVLSAQTTTTNCNTYGSMTNCTSTSNAAQQQQAYEAGQQVGNAIGAGIAVAIESHRRSKWVKHYCAENPGQIWRWTRNSDGYVLASGYCPTVADRQVAAANEFMAKHHDYIPETENANVMVAYLEEHKLDPREERSYERGYKDLKKSGKLQLYSK